MKWGGLKLGYDFDELMELLLSYVPDTWDKREGSIIYNALAPVAMEMVDLYIGLEIFQEQTYLLSATDENLDNRAADFAIPRFPATSAIRKAKMWDENDEPMNVNIGEEFIAELQSVDDEDIVFRVTQNIDTMPDELEHGEVHLTCQTAGEIGNSTFGEVIPITFIANLDRAEIVGDIELGKEAEEDDDFRSRIIEKITKKPFAGNIAAYIEFTKEIRGVGDLKVFPAWAGAYTVLLSVLDENYNPIDSNSVATLPQLKQLIDPEEYTGRGYGFAPINHVVTVKTPERYIVPVRARVTLRDIEIGQVLPLVEESLKVYFNELRADWSKSTETSPTTIFASRVIEYILKVGGVENVGDVLLDGQPVDRVYRIDTPQNQYVPFLGGVDLYE